MTTVPFLDVPPRPAVVPDWKRRSWWLQVGIGGALGAGITLGMVFGFDDFSALDLLTVAAALLVAGWLQVLVHEAGHALAGMAVGLQPFAMGVGPLRAERGANRWRVHWARNIRGVGGFAVLLPRGGEQSPRQTAVYLLGGPLANLFVAWLAWLALRAGHVDAMPWSAAAWAMVGTGLALGLVNLVPFLAVGWSSDGRQLLALWQGKDEARVMGLLTRLGGLAMAGVRPRDWPQELASEFRLEGSPQAVGDALARCRLVQAIDARRFDDPGAAAAAGRLVAGFWQGPDGIRQFNALLLARWVLDTSGDPGRAAAWCAEAEGSLVDQAASRAALQARIALLRGERDEARRQLALAEQLAPRVPDAAGQAMLAESLAELRDQLATA